MSPSHMVLKKKFHKPFLTDNSLYSDIEKNPEWLKKENGACSENG